MRIALLGNPDSVHVQRWVRFLVSRGHELLLLVDPHTQSRPGLCRVEEAAWTLPLNILAFRLTPRPHGNSLWKPWAYRPLLSRFEPDVVHGFEAYYNGLATAWAGPFPKVLSPWGGDIFRVGTAGGLGGWIVRRSLRDVDRITCNDESIAPYLTGTYGIEPGKIMPFSWGIDLEVFSKANAEEVDSIRQELQIDPGDAVVLSPRKWGRPWGSDRLIAALPRVLSPPARRVAVLIGPAVDNIEGQALKRELEQACDPSRLRWLEPNQSPERMAGLYSLAGVFVSVPPTDLLAQTVLEGMACGCFPVLSDRPAYEKHAADRRRAVRVDASDAGALADALINVLENATLRETAARLNVEAMRREEDASVNMLKIEGVYEAAIAAHRERR